MKESYLQAVEEFKRLDHLYYVTLKYTRTVDVIRATLERIISTHEHAVDALLKCLKAEKKLSELPGNPVGKALLATQHLSDPRLVQFIELYLKLRAVMRQPYEKKEEYRRHVTMIVQFEGETLNIDIDKLKEYFDNTGELLRHVKQRVLECKDD